MISPASWSNVILVPRMYAFGWYSLESEPERSSGNVKFMISSDSCAPAPHGHDLLPAAGAPGVSAVA